MRFGAYIRLSTEEQDNGVAIERFLFTIERAIDRLGGELIEKYILQDLMTGKRSDRPNFQALIKAIEQKEIDCVIFPRIDRMGREVEALIQLGKLFEKTKVKAYVCGRDRFIDWTDPDDWEFWARSSVDAEKESRKISYRVRAAHEFKEHKKYANFQVPFGYRRNPESRLYEFNPETIDEARYRLKLLIDSNLSTAKVDRILKEEGKKSSRNGLILWLTNPVLRGHTPYDRQFNHYYATFLEIEFNTHKDILISESQWIEMQRTLNDRRRYRGINSDRTPYSISGLCWCAKCGARCHVQRNSTGNHVIYIRCYSNTHPKGGSMSMRLVNVEEAVKLHLRDRAEILKNTVIQEAGTKQKSDPEILKTEEKIRQVQTLINSIGDDSGLLQQQIKILQQQVKARNGQKKTENEDIEALRSRLSALNNIQLWQGMSPDGLRSAFCWFVDRITIDFDLGIIDVRLHSGLE